MMGRSTSRCDWLPSSSESITLREPVPPIPCRAPPPSVPAIPRRFSRETGSSIRSTRHRAGRPDGAGSPEMLSDLSFFSPRVRGVQSRFRGEFTGDMAGRPDRPCGDRPLGAGLLLCDARLVEDACHHDRWEAPLRSRRAEPPSAREPITLHAPVPPVLCRSPLSLSSPMLRSFSGKLAGKFRQPAVAARDDRTGRAPPILPLT